MKKKRFSVEQIVGVLKQAQVGVPVAEVIRKAGIAVSRRDAQPKPFNHQHIALPHIPFQRRMQMQHRHHCRRLGELKLYIEIRLDQHP
jgi:hypothetical protein